MISKREIRKAVNTYCTDRLRRGIPCNTCSGCNTPFCRTNYYWEETPEADILTDFKKILNHEYMKRIETEEDFKLLQKKESSYYQRKGLAYNE